MKEVILNKNNCEVKSNNKKSQLIEKGFGHKTDTSYFLDFFESYYLLSKKKIKIYKDDLEINLDQFQKIASKNIKNFFEKQLVYNYLIEKGFIVKDGSYFGFDFRIYNKVKKHEHTEYLLDVKLTHDNKTEIQKIIKDERLANSINAKYLLGIVNKENKINIIKIERLFK